MSGKLDTALDDIVKTQRRNRPARRGRAAKKSGPPSGPAGGVKKNTRAAPAKPAAASSAPRTSGDSKIIVSNLPTDVNEGQIKDFFNQTVGAIKSVVLTYGPSGISRGTATITFRAAESAQKALKDVNGLPIDNRPLKVEVVYDAKRAPGSAPIKPLTERVTQGRNAPKPNAKNAPKSAAAPAKGAKAAAGKPAARGRGRRARPGRKPATKEQLDAEMTDYFGGGDNATTSAATAPAAAAPAADKMDEEVL